MRVSKGVSANSPRGTQRVLRFPLRCFVTGSRRPALFGPREVCDGNDEEAVKEARSANVRQVRIKLGLGATPLAVCGATKMNHGSGGHVPVRSVCNTCQSIVPGKECS